MTFLLQLFQFLDPFVLGCVEQEERWHGIRENPHHARD